MWKDGKKIQEYSMTFQFREGECKSRTLDYQDTRFYNGQTGKDWP